jgi:hypothetical protein
VPERRGDVPVDRADVVARLIEPHLGELHAAALEDALVLSGEQIGHQVARADLDLADGSELLAGQHRAAVCLGGGA